MFESPSVASQSEFGQSRVSRFSTFLGTGLSYKPTTTSDSSLPGVHIGDVLSKAEPWNAAPVIPSFRHFSAGFLVPQSRLCENNVPAASPHIVFPSDAVLNLINLLVAVEATYMRTFASNSARRNFRINKTSIANISDPLSIRWLLR